MRMQHVRTLMELIAALVILVTKEMELTVPKGSVQKTCVRRTNSAYHRQHLVVVAERALDVILSKSALISTNVSLRTAIKTPNAITLMVATVAPANKAFLVMAKSVFRDGAQIRIVLSKIKSVFHQQRSIVNV